MHDPASAAAPRRVPRLSIPGGLLLLLCLFLPAVDSCGKPFYPFTAPPLYGPYLFGLLVALLAWLPDRPKLIFLRLAAWAVATLSAAGEGFLFTSSVLSPNDKARGILLPLLMTWIPLFIVLAASVRYRREAERWRVQLLWSGGGLALLFFLSFLFTETAYYGLWLSVLATLLLITEGLWASIPADP